MELEPSSSPILFFAVPEEAGPFRKAWTSAGLGRLRRLSPGRWTGQGLEVQVTGMGPRNAGRVAAEILGQMSPSWVVTAGFAGGLHPDLPRGTVGFSCDPGFPRRIPIESLGARPMRFHQSDRVLVTPASKSSLFRQTGCDAVEMESSAIRSLCQVRGIPSATIRVISDAADEALPLDFGALMRSDDTLDFGRLALELVRCPTKIPELIRFQRRVSEVALVLAKVLVGLGRSCSQEPDRESEPLNRTKTK